MTYQEIIEKTKPDFQTTLADFKTEISKLRSSRLSSALIEDITAECFGSFLPIKQLGSISSISNRELLVQLWDKSYAEGAVRAIEKAELGLSVRIDENNLYLSAPPLSEEVRKSMISLLNKKKEEFFQRLRHLRDKAWKELQDREKTGEIREDDKFRGRDKLDDLTKDFREKMDELAETREKEIKG